MQRCVRTPEEERGRGAWVEPEMTVSYGQDSRRVQGLGWWWRKEETQEGLINRIGVGRERKISTSQGRELF